MWFDDSHYLSTSVDFSVWEVICPDCGDDLGAYDKQPTHIQSRRGPYPSASTANEVAMRHSLEDGHDDVPREPLPWPFGDE